VILPFLTGHSSAPEIKYLRKAIPELSKSGRLAAFSSRRRQTSLVNAQRQPSYVRYHQALIPSLVQRPHETGWGLPAVLWRQGCVLNVRETCETIHDTLWQFLPLCDTIREKYGLVKKKNREMSYLRIFFNYGMKRVCFLEG
jgi:hypothetical protein